MRHVSLLFSLFFVTLFLKAQNVNYKIPDYPGEIMDYTLKYGVFTIGGARLEFMEDTGCDGALILAEAKSGGVVKYFKDIHYRFESCMDTDTGLPSFASRKIMEDEYLDLNTVEYMHNVREDSSIVYSKETDTLVVPKNIFDILTGFYFFRQNYIYESRPIGQIDTITTFFIDVVWDLIVHYGGKEVVDTEFGEVECYKFLPETEVGRYFKTKRDMILWVTADERLIPVKIKIKMRIGTLNATIDSYQSPVNR